MDSEARIIASIGNVLAGGRQLYFTNKSIIVVKTSWRALRLNMLGKAVALFPNDWSDFENQLQILNEVYKRKEKEIPLEHVRFIDLIHPKKGLILRGRYGVIRFWLINGKYTDVKIDIECSKEDFDKIHRLLDTLFPGKIRVVQK